MVWHSQSEAFTNTSYFIRIVSGTYVPVLNICTKIRVALPYSSNHLAFPFFLFLLLLSFRQVMILWYQLSRLSGDSRLQTLGYSLHVLFSGRISFRRLRRGMFLYQEMAKVFILRQNVWYILCCNRTPNLSKNDNINEMSAIIALYSRTYIIKIRAWIW